MDAEEMVRRRARVLTLTAAGLTPQAIARQEAEESGSPQRTPDEVAMDLGEALRERKNLDDGQKTLLVTLERERLDAVQRIMEAVLRSSQGGRCRACGRGGDPDLALKSSATLIRLSERRSQLIGLDARYGQPEAQPVSAIDEIKARRDRKLRDLGE